MSAFTPYKIPTTDGELAYLITLSRQGLAVKCGWGTGEVLIEEPGDRWMAHALADYRAALLVFTIMASF